MELFYEVEVNEMHDRVWVHASDGSTVGRFSIMGIDLHNSVTDQMNGAPQCRLCTHNRSTKADWLMFIEKSKEFWGVEIPKNSFNEALLIDDSVQ